MWDMNIVFAAEDTKVCDGRFITGICFKWGNWLFLLDEVFETIVADECSMKHGT